MTLSIVQKICPVEILIICYYLYIIYYTLLYVIIKVFFGCETISIWNNESNAAWHKRTKYSACKYP